MRQLVHSGPETVTEARPGQPEESLTVTWEHGAERRSTVGLSVSMRTLGANPHHQLGH